MRTFDRCDTLPSQSMEEIGIFSWNLLAPSYEKESGESWGQRFSALKQALLRFAACDVLCFQEVDVTHSLEELRELLASRGFAAVVQERKGFPVVNATFFKASRFQVAWTDHRSRALIVGLTQTDGQQLCAVNVHLEAGEGETHEKQRGCQLASVLKRVRGPAWICGDFNSPLEDEGKLQGQLRSAAYVRAPIQGITFARGGSWNALDHIWASEALQVTATISSAAHALAAIASSGLPTAENPSDHLPVAAFYRLHSSAWQLDSTSILVDEMPAMPSTDICLAWLEIVRLAPVAGTKHEMREHKQLEKTFLKMLSKEEAANLVRWRTSAAKVAKTTVTDAVSNAMVSLAAIRAKDPGKALADNFSEIGTGSGNGIDVHLRKAGA